METTYCRECGSAMNAGAKFCMKCGTPASPQVVEPYAAPIVTPSPAPVEPRKQRNWFARHKILTGLGALVVLIIIAVAAGSGGNGDGDRDGAGDPPAQQEQTTRLFPGRTDAQPEDQERNLAEAATIDGVEATVRSAQFQQTVSDFETDGYVVTDVELRNTGEETKDYNPLYWKIQTPDGQVNDVEGVSLSEGQLESGDLVSGGSVAGKVVFKVGATKGDFYIIWKPDAFDAARGIWKVTV